MSKIIFGIDVGGTTCKCGTFSKEGELLRKEEIPTRRYEYDNRGCGRNRNGTSWRLS